MSEEDKRKQKLSEEDLRKVSGGNGNPDDVQSAEKGNMENDEDEDVVLQRRRHFHGGKKH